MRFPAIALAVLVLAPLALASSSGTDPAGDTDWQQSSPGGPNVLEQLDCSDPMIDVLSFAMWTDADRLRGSINVSDGEGVPSCEGGAVPLFRHSGFLSIRFTAGAGRDGVLAYDLNDLCIFTVRDGGFAGTWTTFPSGHSCRRIGDELQFNVSANGTFPNGAYDLRGAPFDALAVATEMVGLLPVNMHSVTPNGRIRDLAFS